MTPAAAAIVLVATAAALLVAVPTQGGESPTRRVTIHFNGPAGDRETVVVAMPAWYGPSRHPALPLVISPHGRGGSAAGNARRWGDLPARLGLIVLDAGLSGRRLQRESWAWPPEIDELARLPEIVRRQLPYLRFDPRRVYAAGDSMGGQEALMLLARHPDLLAAVAAADPVTNFLERQRQFPRSADSRGEQRRARLEVGASPARAPWLYLRRSPSAYAATIAFAGVPTRLWWSRRDRVVVDQQRTQAGELFKTVKHLNPRTPISERITQDRHGWIFWSDHGLPEIARWLLQHRRRPALELERNPQAAMGGSRRSLARVPQCRASAARLGERPARCKVPRQVVSEKSMIASLMRARAPLCSGASSSLMRRGGTRSRTQGPRRSQ